MVKAKIEKYFCIGCPKNDVRGCELNLWGKKSKWYPQPKVRKSQEISGVPVCKRQKTVEGGGGGIPTPLPLIGLIRAQSLFVSAERLDHGTYIIWYLRTRTHMRKKLGLF